MVDATAGLGVDAIELLRVGSEVMLCEREPVIAAMLQAALGPTDHAPPAFDAMETILPPWVKAGITRSVKRTSP